VLCNPKVHRHVRKNRVMSQESPLQTLVSYFCPAAMLQLPSCPGAQTPLIHIHLLCYRQLSSTHYHLVSAIPWTFLRLSSWSANCSLIFGSLSSVSRFSCLHLDNCCSFKYLSYTILYQCQSCHTPTLEFHGPLPDSR
jgi:hypothetical protein